MKPQKTQYAFWEIGEDIGYWCLFDKIEDAAQDSNGRTIYRLDATPLGKFKIEATLIKVRQRSKKRKKK